LATVEKWHPSVDGTLTETALRRKLERLGFSVSRYVYPPGTSFPPHTHNVEKMDAVVSGRFRIAMGDEEIVLDPGDAILVPSGAEHRAEVVGGEPVISLDAVKRTDRIDS
jgi:quercetin dioxygenase-like cupin family protein